MPKMIDPMNKFMVGARGNGIIISLPPRGPITPNDALLLAAWLVLIAEPDADNTFTEVTEAVSHA